MSTAPKTKIEEVETGPDSELPEGWTASSPLELCELIRGVSYQKGEAVTEPKRGYIPLLRANNIRSGLVFEDLQHVPAQRVSTEQMLKLGDVVLAMSSGSKAVVGKAARVKEAWNGTFGAFCGVLRPAPQIDSRYFGSFFQTQEYRDTISELSAGVNINNLKREYFDELCFRLAPYFEQQRISDKIGELSAVASRAAGRLSRIPTMLKRFRQAVLAAACSGKLTEDWREHAPNIRDAANDLARAIAIKRCELSDAKKYKQPADPDTSLLKESPQEWCVTSMDALTSRITSGSRDWKQYYQNDALGTFVMAQNVRPLRFDDSYRLAVAPPKGNPDALRSEIQMGDLLVTIVGANTGEVCRVPRPLKSHYVCQSVALMRPVEQHTSQFLELYLNSVAHGQAQYREWIYGEGRPHLSFDHLRETAVALPSLEEQHEIVRRVEALFKLADAIEKRVAAASARAEKLTQAILAKAFRGELVPTEAELARREGREYEPASVLLERIRQKRAASTEVRKKGNRRGKKVAQN